MPSTTGRRSRAPESDDESDESRAGTPVSTARNDSKRARRTLLDNRTPSRNVSPGRDNLETVFKTRKERKPVIEDVKHSMKPKHQPGAIVRVKLTNFVTYTSAEFFPGPNLNMVIGPNGTGKSTLVCAICLGLGWGTQHLGRAKDISDFVKHGCKEAVIDIELQKNKTRRNPVLTRRIQRDKNDSTFFLNGDRTTAKVVMDIARGFNIQIDNLCQFLPQDKVVEFAAMTPIELLRSTQQAAAPPEMLKWHDLLKTLRSNQKRVWDEDKTDRETLANLESRQEMNRVDVERMKEKLATQKRLRWLEKCKPIPDYQQAKEKAGLAKETQKRLSTEMRKLKEEHQPVLRRVNAKGQYCQQVQAMKQLREKETVTAEKQCDKVETALVVLDDKMKECDNRINAEKRSRQPKRDEGAKLQQNITNIKNKMEQRPAEIDFRSINQQVQEKTERRREIENDNLKNQMADLQRQGRARNGRLAELKEELNALNTQAGQQQDKLKRASGETYRAWDWIQKNRDLFEKHVYGPPMVECTLKDPKMADVIESFLQPNDFKVITVQTQKDFKLLQQKLIKEQKMHDISLKVCSTDSMEKFQPAMSAQQLNELGLESWAIDQINGPPTVLAMLCQEKLLHQGAVTTHDISSHQYEDIVKAGMRRWVAGKISYQLVRRAEYGSAGESAKTSQIKSASVWTTQAVDAGATARIRRQIGEVDNENLEINAEFARVKQLQANASSEHTRLEEEIQDLKKVKEDKQRELMAFKALPTKLAQFEERLKVIKESLAGIHDRCAVILEEKDRYLLEKAETAIEYAATVNILKEKCESLLEAEMLLLEAQSDVETLRSRNEGINQLLKTKGQEESQAVETAKVEMEKAKNLMKTIKTLRDEGVALQEEDGDGELLGIMQMMSENKTTAEDLDAEIDSLKGKLDLIHEVGGNVVRDFEHRAKRIEELRVKVQQARKTLDDSKYAITEVREKWQPRLEELVARISDKFGESFARIGCAGEVVVFKANSADADDDESQSTRDDAGGNGLDFANWAIHISVRFRENEPLSLLDAHRQSGGERAVSTIFYLMALQSLSRAPFRVVDEINQGMDPRNERMVHGRMVDLATPRDGEDGAGSQYFLITPKLLSGLKYRRGMTILCIVSGENMPAAIPDGQDGQAVNRGEDGEKKLWKVDFKHFIHRAQALGLNSQGSGVGAGGRRVDSGIGLGSSFGSATVDGNMGGSRGVSVGA